VSGADSRPGDVRVVLALVKEGGELRPAAFALYPKWLGAGPGTPTVYTSAVAPVRFEHAAELKDVPLGFVRGRGRRAADDARVKPTPGLTLRGDLGVTHADLSGVRTRLRSYWANQQTGLVDDVVFELQLTPRNWGEIRFQ
jgi:hypothetical protein